MQVDTEHSLAQWAVMIIAAGPPALIWLAFARFSFKHQRDLLREKIHGKGVYHERLGQYAIYLFASFAWFIVVFMFGSALLRA